MCVVRGASAERAATAAGAAGAGGELPVADGGALQPTGGGECGDVVGSETGVGGRGSAVGGACAAGAGGVAGDGVHEWVWANGDDDVCVLLPDPGVSGSRGGEHSDRESHRQHGSVRVGWSAGVGAGGSEWRVVSGWSGTGARVSARGGTDGIEVCAASLQ